MVSGIPFTAAAAFFATGVSVYLQGTASTGGGVRESTVDVASDQWTGGTFSDIRFIAKSQSPLAGMQNSDVSIFFARNPPIAHKFGACLR
jgi:hypothetical protein